MPPAGVTSRTSLRDLAASFLERGASALRQLGSDNRPLVPAPPLPPVMGQGTPARVFQPSISANLQMSPRSSSDLGLTAFDLLRGLSTFDLVRAAIEDLKGQVRGMSWDVAPRPELKGQDQALALKISAAKAWMEMPDPIGRIRWDEWVGQLVEETLSIDAVSILPRMTMAGQFIGLEVIDGATILPLLDARGRPPLPPAMAYQQVIFGRPETQFTLDELWYLPRNRRTFTPYGYPETERAMMSVNLALRSYGHDLAYFTSGNLPDSLFVLGEKYTPEEIDQIDTWWQDILTGRSDRRSGSMRFIGHGEYVDTKTREWKYEFLEWLARVIAWNFQVSAVPLMKAIGRNPSESMEQSSIESGAWPLAKYVASIVTRGFALLGAPEIECRPSEEEVEDAAVIYQRNLAYVHGGAMTYRELRESIGRDAYEGAWANRPVLVTPQGDVVFLDTIEDEQERKQQQSEAFASALAGGASQAGADDELPAEKAAGLTKSATARRLAAAREDLRKWRRKALRCAADGLPQPAFESASIPKAIRDRLVESLGASS